ncbi:hypothetical protein [Pararhizobium qamdonense]|uniref:hypothetical protein n=1 Tax=Pararhizobium qamdonense TaxID=3031126 RepID=UPI0023E1B3C4|nr:hypothetical protein [Pararhizobium qamdonense]
MPKPTSPDDKRLSPEFKENLKKRGFQKGRKRTGGVIPIPPDVKEALKARTMDAVETLFDVMQNSSNDNARVKAAAYFLDPFVSKAAQTVDVNHKHTIADLLTQANQMRLKDDTKTIDITPIAVVEPDASPKLRVVSQRVKGND